MQNGRAGADLDLASDESADEILQSLQDGLRSTEERVVTLLSDVVADSTQFLSELEAALTDMEAALAAD